MKTTLYTILPEQREEMAAQIASHWRGAGLRFAYVYGSVLESDEVHDVDVGVFLMRQRSHGR